MANYEHELLFFFPGDPRPQQRTFLKEVARWLETDKKFLIGELGTGAGKTHLSETLLRCLGGYGVVPQNTLVDAHVGTFPRTPSVKGLANYRCHNYSTPSVEVSCKEGSEQNQATGGRCESCPYRKAKEEVVESNHGITNYDFLFVQQLFRGELPDKPILVLDEAQNFEPKLLNYLSFTINAEAASRVGTSLPEFVKFTLGDAEIVGKDLAALKHWLNALRSNIARTKLYLEAKIEDTARRGRGAKNIDDIKALNELELMEAKIERYLSCPSEYFPMVEVGNGRSGDVLKIQPLSVARFARQIFDRFKRVVFLSGTILHPRLFALTLGIALREYDYVGIPTSFPVENRRVYQLHPEIYGSQSLAMHTDGLSSSLERVARLVLSIANQPEHRNVRGIIHTTSYTVAKALAAEMINQYPSIKTRLIGHGEWALLFQDEELGRGVMKSELNRKANGILISPSMTEGLDLPGDLCRFAIVAKAPLLNITEPYQKARSEYFDRLTGSPRLWQRWQELGTLIQACGRGVRSESDWCSTYLVDTDINRLLTRCLEFKIVPASFNDAATQFTEQEIPNFLKNRRKAAKETEHEIQLV
jgi:Rad3-related DNA helicase